MSNTDADTFYTPTNTYFCPLCISPSGITIHPNVVNQLVFIRCSACPGQPITRIMNSVPDSEWMAYVAWRKELEEKMNVGGDLQELMGEMRV